jgi:G3E family GTPase
MLEPDGLPVVILGGYLGAGKTTLLNRILRERHGRRIGVIVNDFGEVSIDAALLVDHDGRSLSLANGCICCSLADGFSAALATMVEAVPPIEVVVVEASGVADPAGLAAYATLPGLVPDRVLVLVDAASVSRRVGDRLTGATVRRQLVAADLLVVTNSDRCNPDDLAHAMRVIREIAPGTPMVVGTTSALALDAVLETPIVVRPRRDGASGGHGADVHRQLMLRRAEPVDGEALEAFLAALPAEVVRAKGTFRLCDDGRWAIQRAAGGTVDRQRVGANDDQSSDLVIVWVGDSVDVADLAARFAGLAPGTAISTRSS